MLSARKSTDRVGLLASFPPHLVLIAFDTVTETESNETYVKISISFSLFARIEKTRFEICEFNFFLFRSVIIS